MRLMQDNSLPIYYNMHNLPDLILGSQKSRGIEDEPIESQYRRVIQKDAKIVESGNFLFFIFPHICILIASISPEME